MYDRQKDECRSTGDNIFITEIAELSGDLSEFRTANNKKISSLRLAQGGRSR